MDVTSSYRLGCIKSVASITSILFICLRICSSHAHHNITSGSSDANLKIWDIRKKGCIQTYKGHTRGISTVKFTPDGRWLVSGGLDNVVKLLHEFKFHDGPIRSLDSHPLEFLLATGSADRTVKF
ncbi:hypothetical protein HID58_083670 [Brassica napus]|uniref:Uncharacterized protein n=1 Tax=Brassica napus TaxID=3708 RepID=A0ABQ7YFG4_BRANA|nr:hypothetical protein HID58_083670 [Brassica napus]